MSLSINGQHQSIKFAIGPPLSTTGIAISYIRTTKAHVISFIHVWRLERSPSKHPARARTNITGFPTAAVISMGTFRPTCNFVFRGPTTGSRSDPTMGTTTTPSGPMVGVQFTLAECAQDFVGRDSSTTSTWTINLL